VPKLTAAFVERIKPDPSKRVEIPDTIVVGLYLTVQPSGHRSWCVRYRHARRPRKYTIGAYPAVSLAAAREAARAALEQVAKGMDPAAAKAARRGAATFRAVATRYIDVYAKAHQRSWRETQRVLQKEVIPVWGSREFDSISRADVNELLHDVLARGAPYTSNRLLDYLRRLWGWAIDEGYCEHSPCDRVRRKAPEVKRDRVLADAEIRIVWQAWQQQGWPWGPMQKLLLATGQRLREVTEMHWSELDLEAKLWTIGRERTKSDRTQLVPLSELAIETIASLPRFAGSPFVFPSQRARKASPGLSPAQARASRPISGFSMAKREADHLIKAAGREMPEWRWHDLRRTCRTGLSRLRIPEHVAELVIGHQVRGLRAVYDQWAYLSERREALEAWATLLRDILDPARKVVALRR
jgi:integrase